MLNDVLIKNMKGQTEAKMDTNKFKSNYVPQPSEDSHGRNYEDRPTCSWDSGMQRAKILFLEDTNQRMMMFLESKERCKSSSWPVFPGRIYKYLQSSIIPSYLKCKAINPSRTTNQENTAACEHLLFATH